MRKTRGLTRAAALLLAFFVMATATPVSGIQVQAASKKVTLSKKKVSLYVGKKTKVTLKNVKSRVKWQVVTGKKVVSIKKSGKHRRTVTIKAKKAGTAKIRAVYKKKKYTIKVRASKPTPTPEGKPGTPNQTPGANPGGSSGQTPIYKPDQKPGETPGEKPGENPSETPSENPSENQDEEIVKEPAAAGCYFG